MSGKLYFKNDYDAILDALGDHPFYIFGTTFYAHIFYLYCEENNAAQNIKAFLVSDINRYDDTRKLKILHGIPVRDIKWLKETDQSGSVFLAAREKTIKNQLLSLFEENLEGNWYHTGDFVNTIMYYHYLSFPYRNITKRYMVSSNPCQEGMYLIYDGRYKNDYLYMVRVFRGVLPDKRIFEGQKSLDELRESQLGPYISFNKTDKKYESRRRCKIYLAKSHFDEEVTEEFDSPFTETIQVGADLTDMDISNLKDNTGDNVSKRNRDYCEMSAVYWAWKNDKESDYIGLCHYRRRFYADEDMIKGMMEEGYDAIYTLPQITDGGLREEFVERNYFLTPEMWELTGEAVGRLSPEYLESWQALPESFFLISYNMFIMRRDIFEEYCTWVFSILEEVDRHYLDRGIQCDNRYLGYIAELLNTVYVMKNKASLKKGYVKMKMLEKKA